ncbi:hypothetical protein MSG_02467 [Mycobacterium shigaense]|uniref:Uncharacterized protein n=1 Tax=Mycobacterium shigaense TaxID=722731 RepID=A0A1Z4EI21_9MYCO|nr:hypothetical protein MSG_02467 [Mycobacterium shigaense]
MCLRRNDRRRPGAETRPPHEYPRVAAVGPRISVSLFIAVIGLVVQVLAPIRYTGLIFALNVGATLGLTVLDMSTHRLTSTDLAGFVLALMLGSIALFMRSERIMRDLTGAPLVDNRQLAAPRRVNDRIPQGRARQKDAPAVRRNLLRLMAFGAPGDRVAVPLHTGLIPAALADQDPGPAAPACHGHHRHVGEPIVRPDARFGCRHTEPAACAAMFASTSFIHAS